MNPNTQNGGQPRPIQDISPPDDSLGNPIAGTKPPLPPTRTTTIKDDDLDKVLKDVNKDVKTSTQKPWKATRPTLAIISAILVAVFLSVAAFFAFRKKTS